LDRFGGDTGYCPACGAEIWDQAEACPECGEYIDGARSRPPLEEWLRRRWLVVVAVVAIILLLVLVM
jgi:uncharacterized membrane protein YvbJ